MDNLEKFYDHAFNEAMKAIPAHDPLEIAGAYMAIALRLYKTSLDEEDFNKMREVIQDSNIKPYKKGRLH